MIRKLAKAVRGRPPVYPWSKWTDGRIHRTSTTTPDSLIRALRYHASSRRLDLAAVKRGNTVEFQFTEKKSGK